MLKTNIKRNNYIDKEIRIKNEAFNKNWIATNGFVGKSFYLLMNSMLTLI